MRYILPLLLITLISVSTSITVNNTKEINKVDELNSLQTNCSDFIRKKLEAFFPLINKAKYFFGEGKIIQLCLMADVIIKNITDEDMKIIKKFEIFINGPNGVEFEKFEDLLKKYKVNENPNKNERVTTIDNIRNNVFKNELCRKDYELIKVLYKQFNKYYNNIKSYYEQVKNIYAKYSMEEAYKRILEIPLKL